MDPSGWEIQQSNRSVCFNLCTRQLNHWTDFEQSFERIMKIRLIYEPFIRSSVHPMHPSNGLEIFSLSPFLWKAFRWMHLLGSSGETLTQSCRCRRRRDIKTNSLVHIDLTTFDCSMLSLSLSPFLTLSFNLCLALQIRTHLLSQAVLGRHTLSRSRRYRRRWRRRRQRRWRHERFYRFSKRFSVDCSRIVASEREKSSLIILISVFEHKKFFFSFKDFCFESKKSEVKKILLNFEKVFFCDWGEF